MYDRPNLGLEKAMTGLQAVLEEAAGSGFAVAVTIVDDRGEVICSAAQDNVIPFSRELAPRKAYAAAMRRPDVISYRERVKTTTGIPLELLLGPRSTSAQGGVPIKRPGDGYHLGAVGVSGATPDEDVSIARLPVDAMGLSS